MADTPTTESPALTTRDRPIGRVEEWIDSLSDGRFFLLALLPLLAVYLVTATWGIPKTDALTNTIAAWEMGTDGSIVLDQHRELAHPDVSGELTWIIDADGSPVSKYPPGASLLAAPLYAIWPDDADPLPPGDPSRWDHFEVDLLMPPVAPAAITAVLSTALAAALAGLTARPFVGSGTAFVGTYVYGLATGAWGVAADALWQHGPAMLWIALAVWLATNDHEWLSGVAFGMAIITRPPTALIAAAVGLFLGYGKRSIGPVVRIGIGSAAGLAALGVYNAYVFGSASVSGGYSSGFRDSAADPNIWWYLKNVAGGLFDPSLGLLSISPFILLLIMGMVFTRRRMPTTLLAGAIGGVLYLLVQWKANRYSGGDGFVGYRYPLEALAAAAPALFVGWWWVAKRRLTKLAFLAASVYPLSIYATFAF